MFQALANQLHSNVSSCTPVLQSMFFNALIYENICMCSLNKKYINIIYSGSEINWITVASPNASCFVHEKLLPRNFLCILKKKEI